MRFLFYFLRFEHMELLDDRYTDDRCTKSIRYTDDILTNVMCETFRDLKQMYLHAQSA